MRNAQKLKISQAMWSTTYDIDQKLLGVGFT